MAPIRVLLVDDSVEFLTSAVNFLSRDARVRVAGVARCGQDGVWLAEELAPNLVLIDLSMPAMDGLTATRHIKAMPHAPRVVILSLHEHSECRRGASDAGADGFIAKSQFTEGVLAEIDAFFAGPAGPRAPIGTS